MLSVYLKTDVFCCLFVCLPLTSFQVIILSVETVERVWVNNCSTENEMRRGGNGGWLIFKVSCWVVHPGEVKRRAQAEWTGCWRVPGVIWDRGEPARVTEPVYISDTSYVVWFGVCGTDKKKMSVDLDEPEFLSGVERIYRIWNEYIWGTAQVRLRGFGHVWEEMRDSCWRMLKIELPGKIKRRRPKMCWGRTSRWLAGQRKVQGIGRDGNRTPAVELFFGAFGVLTY